MVCLLLYESPTAVKVKVLEGNVEHPSTFQTDYLFNHFRYVLVHDFMLLTQKKNENCDIYSQMRNNSRKNVFAKKKQVQHCLV